MRFWTLVSRSCRLRCPRCGRGRLFHGLMKMHARCPECDYDFERESGFYLGAIYFNYGLTALVISIAFPLLTITRLVPARTALWGCFAFVLVFPLLFFRYARSLWLGFDEWMDPQPRA